MVVYFIYLNIFLKFSALFLLSIAPPSYQQKNKIIRLSCWRWLLI